MLMMLARSWGVWEQPIAADAHGAGPALWAWEELIAADAHDAVPVWGFGKNPLQQMLMMPAPFSVFGKSHCS